MAFESNYERQRREAKEAVLDMLARITGTSTEEVSQEWDDSTAECTKGVEPEEAESDCGDCCGTCVPDYDILDDFEDTIKVLLTRIRAGGTSTVEVRDLVQALATYKVTFNV